MSTHLTLFFAAWAVGMTLLYHREQEYRRDVLTDMMQLVYEYDIDRDELRRSLGYDEVEQYFER